MRGVNKAIILGRVGKDPEVRATASGQTVAGFSLAVSEKWKDKNTGQPVEKTEWLNCSAFGKTAEIIAQYVKTGDPLYVEGKIQTDSWVDQQTQQKRYATKIVVNNIELLGSGGQQQPTQQNMQGFSGGQQGLPPHMQQPQPQQYAPPQGQPQGHQQQQFAQQQQEQFGDIPF